MECRLVLYKWLIKISFQMACTFLRASTASTPERPHLLRQATKSLLPQRQVNTYVMPGNDKLHWGCVRHARQWQAPNHNRWLGHDLWWSWRCQSAHGNFDPTNHDPSQLQWSTIAPAMKLVCLRPPPQQMHWSKTFVSSRREAITGCAVQQSTLLIAETKTKNIVSAHLRADSVDRANNLHHSWQAPKCHKTNTWLVKE